MNKEQWTAAILGLLGASGPLANLLVNTFHVADSTIKPILDILTIGTPLIVGAVFAYMQRDTGKVASVATMSAVDQLAALNKVSDVTKVQIAEATPGVATVVVEPSANHGLQQLAHSPEHPNIVTTIQNEKDVKNGNGGTKA